MSNKENRPKVGFGVYVIKDGKFLVSERLSPHGRNTWSAPGGHLENGEELNEGALREVLEETGLRVKSLRFLGLTNDIFSSEKHYVTIALAADWESGEPERCEPDKCLGWHWVDLKSLPAVKFLSFKNLLKSDFRGNLEAELAKSKRRKI